MGRPLNNNLFGSPLDTNDNLPVIVFDKAIVSNQTLTNVYILKQLKPTTFVVSNGTVSGIVSLVDYDPINSGEACMKVITPSGNTVYAIKIYENTVECSDGNTYYWNRYNYTANNSNETIVVNSMVASQYKAATGVNETGSKITQISSIINHQSFLEDPASTNTVGVGGSGIGATFNVSSTKKSLFTVDSLSFISGGENYKVGDKISIPNVGTIKIKNISSFPNYISTFTLNQSKQLFETDIAGSYSPTGGTGVNATFTATSEKISGYEVQSVMVNNGGTNYKKGDVITTDFGTLNITDVNESTYAITAINVTPPTTVFSFDPSATGVAVTGGSGTGATFNIVASKVYNANTATIADVGAGYKNGDVLTIENSGKATINSVDTGTQGITKITYSVKNTYYSETDVSGIISASGGSGSGATFQITSSLSPLYSLSSAKINAAGTGYKENDTIIMSFGSITVNTVSSSGAIETITPTFNTNKYNTQQTLTAQSGTGGSGTGATFDIASTEDGSGYTITNVVVKTSGKNYSLNDSLTTDFGTITITEIDSGTGAIKTFTFTSDGLYHAIDMSGVIAATGGSGTGATFTISSHTNYEISNISVQNGGTAYAVNDTVSITSYTIEQQNVTTNISATVTGVETGNYAVTGITISNPLIETTDMGGVGVAVTGGSGTGLTINIISSPITGYKISDFKINNAGIGYTVGDTLTVSNIGTISVTKVESKFGIVNAFYQDTTGQTYYTDMSNPNLVVVGGSGTGLTIGVTSKETPQYFVSQIEINQPGDGYSISDVLRIGNVGTVTVTATE